MKLLAFGEIVWDQINGRLLIGGAPFNVACHARKLGIDETYLFSAVGDDALGARTLEAVREHGVRDDFVARNDHPTCVVRVNLDESGQPGFVVPSDTAWDNIRVTREDIRSVADKGFDVFYFGSIAQRSSVTRAALREILEKDRFKEICFDANIRMNFCPEDVLDESFRSATIVKVNEEESLRIAGVLGLDHGGGKAFCEELARRYELSCVCVTRGGRGACLWQGGRFFEREGYCVEVVDPVGAGDAFCAALIRGLARGSDPQRVLDEACRVGAFVASRSGALPDYARDDFREPAGDAGGGIRSRNYRFKGGSAPASI